MTKDSLSLDVIIERLRQNTLLTQDVKTEVTEGFKVLNGRLTRTERRVDKLEWEKENAEKELERAQEEAKEVIAEAALKAKQDVTDKPTIGSTKWILGILVSIILALIAALH